MKRHVALLLGLALLLLSTAAMPAAGAKRTWTAIAGGGTQDQSIVLNAFYPRTLEIAVGDTVTWQVFGFHNIAFPGGQQMPRLEMMDGDKVFIDPRVIVPTGGATFDGMGYHNSGLPQDPSKPFNYSLTFTKAGTYTYACIVHGPGMSGKVVVGKAKSSPGAVAQRAKQEMAASLAAGQSAWKKFLTHLKTAQLPYRYGAPAAEKDTGKGFFPGIYHIADDDAVFEFQGTRRHSRSGQLGLPLKSCDHSSGLLLAIEQRGNEQQS